MQLSQGEIMKAEAKLGRDVGVRVLLMGQARELLRSIRGSRDIQFWPMSGLTFGAF